MEQERAVKRVMLEIKAEAVIPAKYFYYLRKKFERMFAVGYEADHGHCVKPTRRKPVTVINAFNGHTMHFNSLVDAAPALNIKYRTLQFAARTHGLVHHTYRVMYDQVSKKCEKKSPGNMRVDTSKAQSIMEPVSS